MTVDKPDTARSGVAMSKSRHERVREDQDGQRVDNFLIRHCPGVPRSHIYQIIRKGAVLVDGKRVKQTRKLKVAEQVRIPAMQLKDRDSVTVPVKLAEIVGHSILLEHPDFLVVNKPAGLAVHAGSGLSFGLIDALRQYFDEPRLELAHRLDRATSGCLLVAKGMKVNRQLQDLFRQRIIDKHYVAVVDGSWPEQVRLIDAPLRKNIQHAGERRVMVHRDGQTALTYISVKARFAQATLLDIRLDTGRTHQIRVHTKHIGHCIVGDTRYGDNRRNSYFKNLGLSRLYLHARTLGFTWRGEKIQVLANTDSQWDRSLQALGTGS